MALTRAARVSIATYGDSITHGAGTTAADATKNTGFRYPLYALLAAAGMRPLFIGGQASGDADVPQIKHDGVDGETISQIDTRVKAGQPARPAEIVLLHAGTNDINASGHSGATVATDLDGLISDVWNYGQRPGDNRTKLIIVAKLPDIASHTSVVQDLNALIPAKVAAHVAAGRNVISVDMFTALGAAAGANFNQSSVPHPSVAGYQVMAGVWADALTDNWPR